MNELEPGCERLCPGCEHRELTSVESVAQKSSWLARELAQWEGALEVLREARPEERFGYRERTSLRAQWDGVRWKAGLIRRVRDPAAKRGFRDELVAIPGCPVHSKVVRDSIEAFCLRLPGPPEVDLVFVVVSGNFLTLVLRNRELPNLLASLVGVGREIDPARLGLVGVFADLNPSAGDRIHSNHGWHLLWGERTDRRAGLAYGPRSFQQLIFRLFDNALSESELFLAPRAGDRVVDLCSGVGASLVRWKISGASVIGVELGGESAEYLAVNAGRGSALRGRASERIPQLREWARETGGPGSRLLAFVNPPRTGLESEVVEWLGGELRPERVAYLSCSAGTLARDLRRMNALGYAVQRIIPYDFFPGTRHVETLVLLAQE